MGRFFRASAWSLEGFYNKWFHVIKEYVSIYYEVLGKSATMDIEKETLLNML